MKIKLIIVVITLICCFCIYKLAFKDDSYLIAFGDSSCLAVSLYGVESASYNDYLYDFLKNKGKVSKFNNEFCVKKQKIKNIIDDINNNKRLSGMSVLTLLDKAKYITIMIGYDELTSYKMVDNGIKIEFLNEYKKLLSLIKRNTKATIFLIGYYSGFFNNVEYINKHLKAYCQNNDIVFIDVSELSSNPLNFYVQNKYNLNGKGNKILFDYIR